MAAAGSLTVNVLADVSPLTSSMSRGEDRTRQFASNVTSTLDRMTSRVTTLAAGAVATGLAALAGGAGVGIKLAADSETARLAFTTMLRDASQAKQLIGEIANFAAQTPFESPELIGAARSLLAFGTNAQQIIPTLRQLGDISAGLSQPIGELSLLYGKARVSGRLMGDDLNQWVERGVPLIQSLAKQFGVTEGEVRKLVEKGVVGFANLQTALNEMTEAGGMFAGGMKAQSESLSGLYSTMADAIGKELRELGETLVKELSLKQVIADTTIFVELWGPKLRANLAPAVAMLTHIGVLITSYPRTLSIIAVGIAAVIAAAIAWRIANSQLVASLIAVQAFSGPKGWATLAAGAAVATAAVLAATAALDAQMAAIDNRARELAKPVLVDKPKEIPAAPAAAKAAGMAPLPIQPDKLTKALEDQQTQANKSRKALEELRLEAERLANSYTPTQAEIVASDSFTKQNLPDDQVSQKLIEANRARLAGMFDKVALESTGLGKAMREVQQSIDLLGGKATETGQKLQEMIEKGAPAHLVEQYGQLLEQQKLLQANKDVDEQLKKLQLDLALANGQITKGDVARSEALAKGASGQKAFQLGSLTQRLDDTSKATTIKESIATPQQKLDKQLAEITRLVNAGVLTKAEGELATTKARKDAAEAEKDGKKKPTDQAVSALSFGSKEAYNALVKATRPEDKLLKKADEQVQATKEVAKEIKKIKIPAAAAPAALQAAPPV